MQNKDTLPTPNTLCIHFNAGKGQACHINKKNHTKFLNSYRFWFQFRIKCKESIDILVVNQYS